MYRGGKASVATIKLQNFANSRRDTPRARNAAGNGSLRDFIVPLPAAQIYDCTCAVKHIHRRLSVIQPTGFEERLRIFEELDEG
jgi:hypothetical protein